MVPVISFITPHGNRLEHLKQTIPHNLKVCKGVSCEFIVCHSADKSGAAKWIEDNYPQVKNVFINGDVFHYARACNHAHRHATGQIQCTLDADQFLTDEYIVSLLEAFADGSDAIYHEHNANVPGNECAGRIAMLRETFARIGGYEERFRAWGGVDTEMVNRCCDRVGLVNKRRMIGSECIHHGDEIRQKTPDSWAQSRSLFTHLSTNKVKTANLGVPWGMVDDACIPSHGTWGFNAGVLPIPNGYLVAERYLTSPWLWAVMLRRFDAQWNEIERIMPPELIGMEDVRLIKYNGGILAYGTWAAINNTGHVWAKNDIHMAMFKVKVDPLSIGKIVHLSTDFPPQNMEKNWGLFEHDGRLLASYGIRPHLVLEVDEHTGSCQRRYISQPVGWKWAWGEPRGGSNWLRIGDHMLMAGHSMLTKADMETRDLDKSLRLNKDKYYFAFWLLAEAKPPFRIIAASHEPLGVQDGIREIATSRSASVCFPMSLWRDGDDLHLAYGEHDERTRVVTLPWSKIRVTLVPVERAPAPYGEVRCA